MENFPFYTCCSYCDIEIFRKLIAVIVESTLIEMKYKLPVQNGADTVIVWLFGNLRERKEMCFGPLSSI